MINTNKTSAFGQRVPVMAPISPSKTPKTANNKSARHFVMGSSDAAFRQAAESGYLVSPTRTYILDRCGSPDKKRSLKEIHYIHLTFEHIRTLGHIQACRRLKICILHNNYLTRFHALANCPELIRLDLHSNQISRLPGGSFWVRMRNLEVLNLHDNGIGDLDSVQYLSECPTLSILTLYDTPLCFKTNYRHHTVNSIWTLRALDHHVISDEEIIEDATFPKQYGAFNPALFIDLCPKETVAAQQRTLELELNVVHGIMEKVNQILRRTSPVIIIQRWVRGYLARKRMNVKYKDVTRKLRRLVPSEQITPGDSFNMDFDTYMENRRPGSKTPSAGTNHRSDSPSVSGHPPASTADDSSVRTLPLSLHINLAKLENIAMKKIAMSAESPDMTEIYQKKVDFDTGRDSRFADKSRLSYRHETSSRRTAHPTVQQMLGPNQKLVQPPKHQEGEAVEMWVNGEQPQHIWRIHRRQFQLMGGKVPHIDMDPVERQLILNRDSGRDVREAEEYWHDEKEAQPLPIVKRTKPIQKMRDDVSLATLVAVSKAYRDRDRANQLAGKMDQVMRIQQEKLQARYIVNAYKEERRNVALSQRQEDNIRVTQALQQNEMLRSNYIEYAQDRKDRASNRHRERQNDLTFAADFNNQQMSVSSALVRHDRQSNIEDIVARKREVVTTVQMQLSEQADLVKRYMEHKQLMQQLASGQERAEVGTQALREANDRLLLAKQRVASIKARKAAVQALHRRVPIASTLSDCQIDLHQTTLPSDGIHGSQTFISQFADHEVASHTTAQKYASMTGIVTNSEKPVDQLRSITAPQLQPHFNYLLKT